MLTEGTYTGLACADRAPHAEIVTRFGGIAIDDRTVAFRSATQAVECAIALAEQAPGAIGLHAGELGAGHHGVARPVVLAAGLATIAGQGAGLERCPRAGAGRPYGRAAGGVADDGRGGADASGGGLRGLRDRVAALDGELLVISPPGGGTVVAATLPLPATDGRGGSRTA